MARIKLKVGEKEIEVDSRDFYVDNNTLNDVAASAPQWMHDLIDFRKRLFLQTVEPIIVGLLGPVVLLDGSQSPSVIALRWIHV